MNSAHRKTLSAVFSEPANGAIPWSRIEALLMVAGCHRVKGSGSSVTFEKDGMRTYFYWPHPHREARQFLSRIGVVP